MSSMDGPSSITTTTRSELSLLYRVLRTVIRPLRPRLVKPGKPLPAGSPKLDPPRSIPGITEHQSHGLYEYTFAAPTTTVKRAHHSLFYFAGGGFQSPPSSEHWKTCKELASRLAESGYAITIVSYPLAPNSPAPKSLPMLRDWLRERCAVAASHGESITLAGDSAGGNVVLNLGLWWAEEMSRSEMSNPVKQILAISPATDLRNDNPQIAEADKRDPVLSVGLTTDVGKKWAANWGVDHPEVSPNLSASIPALRNAGIKVHGVVGTADVLAPDALVFKDMCEKHGVTGQWLVWEDQMHCFPLAAVYGLSEGKAGRDWVIDVLQRNIGEPLSREARST